MSNVGQGWKDGEVGQIESTSAAMTRLETEGLGAAAGALPLRKAQPAGTELWLRYGLTLSL